MIRSDARLLSRIAATALCPAQEFFVPCRDPALSQPFANRAQAIQGFEGSSSCSGERMEGDTHGADSLILLCLSGLAVPLCVLLAVMYWLSQPTIIPTPGS